MAKKKATKKKTSRKSSAGDEHGQVDISSELEALDEYWEDVEEQSMEDVPDGKYQVKIDAAVINNSKSSGRLQCSWTMTIVSGKHKGRKLFKHDGLDDESQLGWFRGGLARLGLEWPGSARDLPDTLDEAVDTYAEINARTKVGSEYQNVYFNKALDDDAVDAEELEEWTDDDVEDDGGGNDGEWSVGDRCIVEIEGDEYAGEINGIEGDKVSIAFDDGDEGEHSIDELMAEEGDEDEPEEEPEGDDAAVTVTFDDSKITATNKKKVDALAKKNEFDPDDYDTSVDLLCDLAEHLSVEGEFKSCASLLKACADAG
jgi:hypothetical protein